MRKEDIHVNSTWLHAGDCCGVYDRVSRSGLDRGEILAEMKNTPLQRGAWKNYVSELYHMNLFVRRTLVGPRAAGLFGRDEGKPNP